MAARKAAPARKATFGFDLSKPSKKAVLLKQGQFHKAFKYRFFVLYPGFLVYYEDEHKWKCDIARGETLGYRIGAVKLKGGSVHIARNAPKGCKYGLIINAPDPLNKRPSYLLNATSKPDRDAWIEAVRKSIPLSGSPTPGRNGVKQHTPKETPKPKSEPVLQHPMFTMRQDTADVAAIEASGVATEEETLEETSIDQIILPPSMVVRHNTADAAALLATSVSPPVIERVTSIDDELGPSLATADSSRENTPVANGVGKEEEERSVTPPPTPTELETKETVESSVNARGKTEVVTSVTVVANGIEDKEDVVEKETEPVTTEEEPDRRTSEVTFTREEPSNSFSVIVVDVDSGKNSTATSSDNEGESSVKPESQDQTEVGSPSATPPAITVAEAQLRQQEATTPGLAENGNGASLSPPESPVEARKSFIEKRGFLYKRGGRHKNWNLRYFVLQPGGFTYYKKDPRTKPLGEVKLKNMNIFFPGVGEKQQSFQFHVHTESAWNKRPNWVLAAQSEREMKAWIQAFKFAGMRSGTSPVNSDSEGEPNGAIPTRS